MVSVYTCVALFMKDFPFKFQLLECKIVLLFCTRSHFFDLAACSSVEVVFD